MYRQIDKFSFARCRVGSVLWLASLFLIALFFGCSENPSESDSSSNNSQEKLPVRLKDRQTTDDHSGKPRNTSSEPSIDYALSFDGEDDYVKIPSLKYDGSHPLTIEATVTPLGSKMKTGPPTIVGDWGWKFQGMGLVRIINNKWKFGLFDEKSSRYSPCHSITATGMKRKVTLAGVFDGNSVRLFIDGKLDFTYTPVEKYIPSPRHFLIGASWRMMGGVESQFCGIVDEVRISNIARYTKDYTPPDRFKSDDDTLALFYFDEGNGQILKDSSPNKNDGKIVGATWILTDEISTKIRETESQSATPKNSKKALESLKGSTGQNTSATSILLPAQNLDAFDFRSNNNATRQSIPKSFSLDNGILRAKGTETAFLISKQEFRNYHLVIEYQWVSKNPNDMAGIIVNTSTNTLSLPIVSGIQCELPGAESRHAIGNFSLLGKGAQIRVDKKVFRMGSFAQTLKNNPEKPAGEWNKLEILSDGSFEVKINGHVLLDGRWQKPNAGRIVLQLQRGEIRFRRMEIISFDTLTEKAYRLARAGKWKEAAKKFGDAVKRHPEAISSIRGLHLATLYAAAGNKKMHKQFCRNFFERFSNPQITVENSRPAKAYLIFPNATDPELLKLSLAAATRATTPRPRGQMGLWFQLSRGMAEYRSKNYQEARGWLARVSKSRNAMQRTPALAFLAMTEFHRGRKAVAKRLVAQAKAANQEIKKPSTTDFGRAWNDILGAQLALKEAIALIGDVIAETPPLTKKPEPKLKAGAWQQIPTKNLKEWSDPGKWWKEENGTIVGESKGGANLPNVHFLTWNGSLKDNFELSVDYRIISTEPRDAGLYFRVERNKMNKQNLVGYQAELDTGTQFVDKEKRRGAIRFIRQGKLFGHIHDGKRGRMFQRNKSVTIAPNGKLTTKPLAKKFHPTRVYRKSPEWNNCRIQVVGDRIRLYLNGVLANELVDGDSKNKSKGDAIALQFRPFQAHRFEVKDLKYRKLLK